MRELLNVESDGLECLGMVHYVHSRRDRGWAEGPDIVYVNIRLLDDTFLLSFN